MRTLVAVALCLFLASGARGWPVGVGKQAPTSLAVDGKGNILGAIPVRVPKFSISYDIAKFDRIDGHVRWRHRLNGNGSEQSTEVGQLVLTGDGDPIVAGTILDTDGESFLVARLAAGNGEEHWRSRLRGSQPNPSFNSGRAAAMDANGDVVVAGTVQNGPAGGDHPTYGDFAVVKLDGGTGSERWRLTLPAPPVALGSNGFTSQEADAEVVTADDAGNIIAAGEFFGAAGSATVNVVKLSGGTGQLLWRQELDFAWRTTAIAIDSAGDIFLGVSINEHPGNDFGVVKLSGSSGDVLWEDRESGGSGVAARVLIDVSGDVFASGAVGDGTGRDNGTFFTVVRLAGRTGSRLWAYHTEGTAGGGYARQLALGVPGLLVAGGSTEGTKTCADVFTVALDTSTGALVWSRKFDGTYRRRKFGCAPTDDGGGPGPPLDNDNLGAMVTDAHGRLFAGIALTNGTSAGVRDFGSIRRLSPHR